MTGIKDCNRGPSLRCLVAMVNEEKRAYEVRVEVRKDQKHQVRSADAEYIFQYFL